MNPYWINRPSDESQWLESEAIKKNFYILVVSHIALWIIALIAVILVLVQAQTTPPILAFTAKGQAASGTPIPLSNPKAAETMDEFINAHIKEVSEYMFMRTEKGSLPALENFVNKDALAIFNKAFSFTEETKGGYTQTLFLEEFDELSRRSSRRVYRAKGILSNHSLAGSANTPLFLVIAADRVKPTYQNPHGWVVSVIVSISADEYATKERNQLIEQATKARREIELQQ